MRRYFSLFNSCLYFLHYCHIIWLSQQGLQRKKVYFAGMSSIKSSFLSGGNDQLSISVSKNFLSTFPYVVFSKAFSNFGQFFSRSTLKSLQIYLYL